jgi:hypothetical protein
MDIPTPFGDAFLPGWANQHPLLHLLFIQWPIGLAPAVFTCFLPAWLGYRRGQMAWIGAAVSLILSALLPLRCDHETSETSLNRRIKNGPASAKSQAGKVQEHYEDLAGR